MKKENIITLPHPSLRQRSKRVGVISPEILKLIENMKDAVLDWDKSRPHEITVALAAVQVNELYRVVIMRDSISHKDKATYTTFINPEITKYEGEEVLDYEGCLSIKDVYGMVPRANKIRIKAIDLEGNEVRMKIEGYYARILQHEVDHTNGIVFIDRIKEDPEAFFRLRANGNLDPLDYQKDVLENTDLWK